MKKLLFISALIFLSGCNAGFPGVLNQGPDENAPPMMRAGWKDGCNSGIAVYGNDIYKSLYSYKIDANLVQNKMYYSTWQDAYNYCRHWMNNYLKNGLLGQEYSPDLRDPRVAKEGSGLVPEFLGW